MGTRGFTLLELMVVVLIIAILSAIAIPLLRSNRDAARRTSCASNLNQLAKACYMYADVPANGMFPTSGPVGDQFGSTKPLQNQNLLFKGYVASTRVFSCPSKPLPYAALDAIAPTRDGYLTDGGAHMASSYGYDPGHGPNDAVAAIMADKKGTKQNSDNHGPNAWQNVLIGNGTVGFLETTKNPLGNDANGKPLGEDADIFGLNNAIPRTMDGYIRQ